MFKDIFKEWDSYTIENLLQEFVSRNKNLLEIPILPETIKQFKETEFFHEINTKVINGKSVEQLKNVYNDEDLNTFIKMTKIFSESIEISHKYSPIIYLLKICKKLIELKNIYERYNKWNPKFWGFLGRSYKSFASFIRDIDSKEKIKDLLSQKEKSEGLKFEIVQNPILDTRGHTDILIIFKKNNHTEYFRIWLYQSTTRGLKNLVQRLQGLRRELEKGFHILTPIKIYNLDIKVEDCYDWRLYSISYLDNIINICIDCYHQRVSSIIDYNDFKNRLNFDENYSKKLTKVEKDRYIKDWSIETSKRLKEELSTVLIIRK